MTASNQSEWFISKQCSNAMTSAPGLNPINKICGINLCYSDFKLFQFLTNQSAHKAAHICCKFAVYRIGLRGMCVSVWT